MTLELPLYDIMTYLQFHKNKDVCHNPNICYVCPLTNEEIVAAVERAREKAKKTIQTLRIAVATS